MPDVELKLPELEGKDIVEHFYNIGEEQCAPYRDLLKLLSSCNLPQFPKVSIHRNFYMNIYFLFYFYKLTNLINFNKKKYMTTIKEMAKTKRLDQIYVKRGTSCSLPSR